jgi:hypothetical protein
MDDFNINVLNESKNEWCGRLLNILTPFIIEGLKSIFNESTKLCSSNGEMDKYLMTFQNFISRIPKWSQTIIDQEKERIIEKSKCNYLEDLITCVHIIQLKVLTAIRVGNKQKKIDIEIPKLDVFIHKIYINIARKVYTNVYLFEINVPALTIQKNNRQLEILVQESIMNTIRDSVPVETILRAYMDETVEEDVIEEVKEKEVKESEELKKLREKLETPSKTIEETNHIPILSKKDGQASESVFGSNTAFGSNNTFSSNEVLPDKLDDSDDEEDKNIKFNDMDMVRDINNNDDKVLAPKTFERLDEISNIRNEQRKLDEETDDDDDDEPIKLKIFDNSSSNDLGIELLEPEILTDTENLLAGMIEELH